MPQRKNNFKPVLKRLSDELKKAHYARVIATGNTSVQERQDGMRNLVLREPAKRAVIDEACRSWVLTAKVPMMEPEDAILFWYRIYEANNFAGLLWYRGFARPKQTEDEFLIFLLIESWQIFGLFRMKAQLIDLLARK